MHYFLLIIAFLFASCFNTAPNLMEMPPPSKSEIRDAQPNLQPDSLPRFSVLVFSKTSRFRHESIPAGIDAVHQLGRINNFAVTSTEDAGLFTLDNLVQYQVVVFMNSNGDNILNDKQKKAFEQYIKQGGGFVGVHSAAATEYQWPWYEKLVGAWFEKHPKPQPAEVLIQDSLHVSTKHLPQRWQRFDEWYNFRTNPRDVAGMHVLAVLNENSYTGGTMGEDHPIAWMHLYDGGRAWYTGLGHTIEAYSDADFLTHLLGGIEWAASMGSKG